MNDTKRNEITATAVVVDGNDIDTDRIIPARYLRCVTFDGLGEHAFEDDRAQMKAQQQTHPFDDAARQQARILVVGRNFGCGSSREHAPQALMRWGGGLGALVGESFAEIFFANCLALGIPCVTAAPSDLAKLAKAVHGDANLQVSIDLNAMQARFGGQTIDVQMPAGPREQLLNGRWDSLAGLLDAGDAVEATARELPYFDGWQ
jgi:3-isopropylmalate/(R)-2-methylmalate dehydratase small subunit